MNNDLIEATEDAADGLVPHPAAFDDEGFAADESGLALAVEEAASKGDLTGELDATRVYLNNLRRSTLLTPEQEQHYGAKALQGDQAARNVIIESNLRLVVAIARRYQHRGMPLLDMINEGNLGLMRAAQKFDPGKGFRFSTYATWWIRQAIERALMAQTRTIRLPVHVVKEMNACLKAQRRLADQLGREPGTEAVADYLGRPVEQVEKMLKLNERVTSFEVASHGHIDKPLSEIITDGAHGSHEDRLDSDHIRHSIAGWVMELPERQREVICRRYGLCGYEEATLEQVACAMGLTRERIRQIQVDGLRRLKRILHQQGYSFEEIFS